MIYDYSYTPWLLSHLFTFIGALVIGILIGYLLWHDSTRTKH